MTDKDHSNWKHALFYVALALLACHELDAVARHEWRLLPILSSLDDDTGMAVFVLLHIPLFAVLFLLTGHRDTKIRRRSQLGIDAFLIVHAIGHFAMSGHERYEFTAPVETITIYGGAIIGAFHAWLELRKPSLSD